MTNQHDKDSLDFYLSEEEFATLCEIEEQLDYCSKIEEEVIAIQEGRACPVIDDEFYKKF